MVTTESPTSRVSHITLDRKQTGKPIAGNRHDGFEVAGAGTQLTVRLMRHSQRKRGAPARRDLRSMALALDPTTPDFSNSPPTGSCGGRHNFLAALAGHRGAHEISRRSQQPGL